MSSYSPENWHKIPTIPRIGSLIDPYGGRRVGSYKEEDLVRIVERDNEICWETYTSKEETSYSLVQEGFKAIFHDIGVVVRYDSEGNLSAVRIEVLPLLNDMLDKFIDTDDEKIDLLFGLADFLDEYDSEFEAHLDLSTGQYLMCGIDGESGENKILAIDKKDSFEDAAILMITLYDHSFCVTFQRLEESMMVGIGVMEKEDDELSPVGSLSNDVDKNDFDVTLLTIFLANDCNYMTYLENKNPDRFDRLARRIITD